MAAKRKTEVKPLSVPSGKLMYMDTVYKKGRSKMRRFKIKYSTTSGGIKTRNIKATSEDKALSEITDMGQHHYTIIEGLDDEPAPKEISFKVAALREWEGFPDVTPPSDSYDAF
jgi:hypothetical protein